MSSHPLDSPNPQPAQRKIRKKSIRNAKDSAEMARTQYHRKVVSHTAEESIAAPSPGTTDRRSSVSNVGNDGTRLLRHEEERSAAGRVTSPPTPPQTSETRAPSGFYWHDGLHESAAALVRLPSGPSLVNTYDSFDSADLMPKRGSSDLHLPNRTSGADPHAWSGSFGSPYLNIPKQRDGSSERPRTADVLSPPMLEVRIPHYRIGTPRFSERGTAFLHNSFHTAFSSATDLRASVFSNDEFNKLFPAPPGQRFASVRKSRVSWFSPSTTPQPQEMPAPVFRSSSIITPPEDPPEEETYPATLPLAFSAIAANPDDPLQVTYQPTNKEIAAATPVRLVSEITSANFLDYDLLSDFFLTYRSFLSPADLARYLVARLRWAVSQNDDAGQVVRVRTFVAMRHWILNYFLDDFEPNHELRILFCELINQLSIDLQNRPGGGGGDLKVVGELKKCWRRTCETVWGSSAEVSQKHSPMGSRDGENNPGVRKSPMMMAGGDAEKDERSARRKKQQIPAQSYFAYVSPLSARGRIVPASPFSEQSIHVTSCAIPVRKRSRPILSEKGKNTEKQTETQDVKSSPPKLLQRKLSHRHQRSSSFSDALRDDRVPISSTKSESFERVETPEPSVPGDLIRGYSLQPNPSNIVFPAPLSPPITDDWQDGSQSALVHTDSAGNPAVVKIFGSVRRALSTRHSPKSSLSGGHKATSSGDLRTLRPSSRQMLGRETVRKGQNVRSDALAAIVVRSYEQNFLGSADKLGRNRSIPLIEEPVTEPLKQILVPAPRRPMELSRFNSHITTGSRSIVIFDDTGIPESERTPDLESAFTSRTLSEDQLFSRTRRDTAEHISEAVRDMAMNNTAFLLPEPHASFAQEYWPNPGPQSMSMSTASVGTTLTMAPHSPPPAVPLPPLPGMSTVLASRSAETPHSLRPSTRSEPPASLDLTDAVLDDMGLQSNSASEEDLSKPAIYRRSSVVNPSELNLGHVRPLRRKPGGDLRAVNTVQHLGFLHRQQSTGSPSTPGASSPTSTHVSGEILSAQIASVISGRGLRTRVTDGKLIETARKSSLRLLSTHSSQPNMRASFEVEVRRLAMIPTREDEGDIEATLLKLEGKFEPSRVSTATLNSSDEDLDFPVLSRQGPTGQVRVMGHPDHPETSRLDLDEEVRTPMTETQGASIYRLSQTSHGSAEQASATRRDVDGAPLESDLAKQLREQSGSSTLPPSQNASVPSPRSKVLQFKESPTIFARDAGRGHARSKSDTAAKRAHSRDDSNATTSTFLLDENESLYDGASMVSRASSLGNPSTRGDRSFYYEEDDDDNDHTQIAGVDGLSFVPHRRPPTPPTTIGASSEHALDEELLLPGPAPSADVIDQFQASERLTAERGQITTQTELSVLHNPQSIPALRVSPTRPLPTHHTPFILAFRSTALAEQMTLIEKDALDCIDWKDLINLQWCQNTSMVRDWASFLHTSSSNNASSIDLIITRFNLVTKWCISSVLLCGTAMERMQCIVKFIHIAVHARKRLRNFATAAQLTIALCSSDLARLGSTWALVPTSEKDALKSLEELVSPVRNFAALRTEMETAAAGLEDHTQPIGESRGVIPFLGVYTRDLALNAQNPAFVPPAVDEAKDGFRMAEKLVNFERHRTAATIVKGVLRLLDASAKYTIRTDPELLTRCLWLATLGDGEITSLSKNLE
ncbi:hypothetical protein MBLNU459_g2742t2 [Dothideomycetes sp. NU459]